MADFCLLLLTFFKGSLITTFFFFFLFTTNLWKLTLLNSNENPIAKIQKRRKGKENQMSILTLQQIHHLCFEIDSRLRNRSWCCVYPVFSDFKGNGSYHCPLDFFIFVYFCIEACLEVNKSITNPPHVFTNAAKIDENQRLDLSYKMKGFRWIRLAHQLWAELGPISGPISKMTGPRMSMGWIMQYICIWDLEEIFLYCRN